MRFSLCSVVLVLASCVASCATSSPPAPASPAGASPTAASSTTAPSTAAAPPASPAIDAELDGRIARALDEELARVLAEPRVRSALGVALDPRDGRVLAMQSLEGDHRDPALPASVVRCHGSLAKTLSIAAALEAGVVGPDDRVAGGGEHVFAGAPVRDIEPHGAMTVADVLVFSSNVGATQVFERLGREPLYATLARFHLDHRVPEVARTDDAEAARVAYGAGLEATPLELATAFAAVANGGVLHAPWRTGGAPTPGERALAPETAAAMMAMLESAVSRDDGTGWRARVPGHRVAGKTGTALFGEDAIYGAFVGAVPADAPRLVVLVGVVAEGREYGGGTLAAPAFARIATRVLTPEAE